MTRQTPGPTARYRAKRRRAAAKVVKVVRPLVVDRAASCCERCGVYVGDDGQAHHRLPRSRGGAWTLENIAYLCASCHSTAHRTNTL